MLASMGIGPKTIALMVAHAASVDGALTGKARPAPSASRSTTTTSRPGAITYRSRSASGSAPRSTSRRRNSSDGWQIGVLHESDAAAAADRGGPAPRERDPGPDWRGTVGVEGLPRLPCDGLDASRPGTEGRRAEIQGRPAGGKQADRGAQARQGPSGQ